MSLITVDPATARRSPLADRPAPGGGPGTAGLRLTEIAHLGKLKPARRPRRG